MSSVFGYSREAVRVKVKKCEGNLPAEWRKFSVDPQITSLEVLYSILAKAFDLKTDFGISYKTLDPNGQETYLVVLSDWDLDAAFLRAHNLSISTKSEPCLNLRVDIKPFSEAPDWDGMAVTSTVSREIVSIQQSIGVGQKYVQNKLPGLIMNQMEKTFSMVQRALNLVEDPLLTLIPRTPLSDSEFRTYCDSVGQIIQPNELRKVIYAGGIDPSLRRVVWKHILNVYPDGMTGRERMDYMKRKSGEYFKLRDVWRGAVQQGNIVGELAYVTGMVRKDVLRTDRLHPFYAGSDDNQNIAALFNILTTYALNHPAVSYCQGMSDIASPLLVTMGDEAQAYICFCAVMTRLSCNFMLDGIAMTQKFTHLAEALQYYDPDFYAYLKLQQADDLLFCYRWLLLEMKREFAFEDSLRMLEVLWSSLPSMPPKLELALFEKEYEPPPIDIPQPKSPSVILRTPRENPYTKICALRRQSSALSLTSSNTSTNPININATTKLNATKRFNLSLDENITRERSLDKNITKGHQSLDEAKMTLVKQKNVNKSVGDEEENVKSPKYNNHFNNISENHNDFDVTEADDNVFDSPQHSKSPSPCKSKVEVDVELDEREITPSPIDTNPFLVDANNTQPQPANHHPEHNHNKHKKSVVSPITKTKGIFSSSTGNLIAKQLNNQRKNISSTGGGHFKELKEKIAASKKGIFASLDKIETDSTSGDDKKPKLVKNFNEFLSFASINKSRISDRLNTKKISSSIDTTDSTVTSFDMDEEDMKSKPLIKLTKSSFDDSDSSSLGVIENIPLSASSVEESAVFSPNHSGSRFQMQLTNNKVDDKDGSSPDDSQEYFPMTTSMTRELRLELENLDRHVFGTDFHNRQRFYTLSGCIDMDTPPESGDSIKSMDQKAEPISYKKLDHNGSSDVIEIQEADEISDFKETQTLEVVKLRIKKRDKDNECDNSKRISSSSVNNDVFVWENPLHQCESSLSVGEISVKPAEKSATTPDEQAELDYDGEIIDETMLGKKSATPIRLVRRTGDTSNNNSNRNSMILTTESDSDESERSTHPSLNFKFNPNNPFYEPSEDVPIPDTTDNQIESTPVMVASTQSYEEASEASNVVNVNSETSEMTKIVGALPPPTEFGGGNPFLMFLCITILLQHRDYIVKTGMDYNEMAMHFDKMVRKHNVVRVLNQARRMYSEYMKMYGIKINNIGADNMNPNRIMSGLPFNT